MTSGEIITASQAAGPWYTSGTFWAAVAAGAGLLGALVVLITWRLGAPRRVLTYNMPVATSLLTTHSQKLGFEGAGLKVIYKDDPLVNPYLVQLNVDSRSRRDIKSSDFDQGKSVIFDIGVPVKTVVGGITPSEPAAASADIEGNTVKLAPSLIKRGNVLRLNLLVDGRPTLSCQSSLIDVTVKRQEAGKRLLWLYWISGLSAFATIVLVLFLLFSVISTTHFVFNTAGHIFITFTLIVAAASAITLTTVAINAYRARRRRGEH